MASAAPNTSPIDMTQIKFDPTEHPHRRFNPLTGKHILVSPHRTKRPWNGQTEPPSVVQIPSHDPSCFLCPGNKRVTGDVNPDYGETYVFPNDFSALLPTGPTETSAEPPSDLFSTSTALGRCKVICFHPRHDLTLAIMSDKEIESVIEGWKGVYRDEGEFLRSVGEGEGGYVQIFENRGSMMGASAPHPHGQVWTLSYVPDEPQTELDAFQAYTRTLPSPNNTSSPVGIDGKPHLLLDYAAEEIRRKERIVELDEEGGWMGVVPYWATWPYELLILPTKRQITSILELTPAEAQGLARVMKRCLVRYDNLFSCSFPYSMCIHQAPVPLSGSQSGTTSSSTCPAQLHLHFYPPLLRSASVRKFLVGFEMACEAQRDLTPEQAAARLRELPSVHYTETE